MTSEVVEVDWVVVGGGSAGCVLANRLSEDASKQVLLLEAGDDWRPRDAPEAIRVADGWRPLDDPDAARFNWPDLQARRTRVQPPRPYPRGRGLGGSSVINAMAAVRPTPDDFNSWAAAGCVGWSFDEMLPYLCRLESDADFGQHPYHGSGGPIPVARLARTEWNALDEAFAETVLRAGHSWCEDYNAPTSTGLSPVPLNMRDDRRVTTNEAYLEPARERSNLEVICGATVDRVLLDGDRAIGVRFDRQGVSTDVYANGVVLAAGAVHSPAILIRSGIGPEARRFRLPVGEGLQDHPLAALWLRLRPDVPAARFANSCLRYSSELEQAGENDMLMAVTSRAPKISPEVREALAAQGATGTWGGGGLSRDGVGDPSGLMVLWANQVSSRGTLRLSSMDPAAPPEIEHRMLEAHTDLVRLRDGMHRVREVLSAEPMRRVVEGVAIDFAGTDISALEDDTAIDSWLMQTVGDGAHLCGTCHMGSEDDPRSVVDPEARVLGVDALWVADASVFPTVPRANTHVATLAVAERVADLLRGVADERTVVA